MYEYIQLPPKHFLLSLFLASREREGGRALVGAGKTDEGRLATSFQVVFLLSLCPGPLRKKVGRKARKREEEAGRRSIIKFQIAPEEGARSPRAR